LQGRAIRRGKDPRDILHDEVSWPDLGNEARKFEHQSVAVVGRIAAAYNREALARRTTSYEIYVTDAIRSDCRDRVRELLCGYRTYIGDEVRGTRKVMGVDQRVNRVVVDSDHNIKACLF
jgi:hypothetical protein